MYLEGITTMGYSKYDLIFKLSTSGISKEKLSAYFKTTDDEIEQIIEKQKIKKYVGNPDIKEIDTMCRILGWHENERAKLQSILHKNGYTAYDQNWRNLRYDDILKTPFLGKEAATVIWLAQNMEDRSGIQTIV